MIQSIRGMNDILPVDTPVWQYLESQLKELLRGWGYQEIRMPVLEETRLFSRTIGEVTDIVEKEMYTFSDRNGDSLTLRPEGTAGCVRAGIQHGLFHNRVSRLWYTGPMFRYERPQKGRYRQFHQVGVEAFGIASPYIDGELIRLTGRLWELLGLTPHVTLEINNLGTPEVRATYRDVLVDYLSARRDQLDADSIRRLDTNPLRILDSKNPAMKDLLDGAPRFSDYLDESSAGHQRTLLALLDDAGIAYRLNPRLVRGLDYYTQTVFEWVTDSLGAQGTVCAGGRYDGLVRQLGGRETPAAGFAIGLERLVLMLRQLNLVPEGVDDHADIYLVASGEGAHAAVQRLAGQVRSRFPERVVLANCEGGSFKSQMKKADKCGAGYALIVGEKEVAESTVVIKSLREAREQQRVPVTEVIRVLEAAYSVDR